MASLSVGQVSALIAAGTAIVQLLLPLVIPLILIAYINKKHERVTASAATWSTLNRALHSSWWPTILQSDSAGSQHVALCVSVATYIGVFVAALVAIAAVITPLGLYDAISAGNRDTVAFTYARDPSPLGYGTPPRSDLGFSRTCEGRSLVLCPGTNFTLVPGATPYTQMYVPDGYNTSIPLDYQGIWSSGLSALSPTVSSIFDIQYRSPEILQQDASGKVTNYAGVQINNGSAYLAGGYRNLYTVLLRNSTEAYEGLVVDTVNGGVGFRNHTIPPTSTYGSTWTEDILFVQPETRCVDTNLTIDYTLTQNNISGVVGVGDRVWLTDKGGFSSLEPNYNWHNIRNRQDDAQLYERAYTAAWLNNLLSMMYLNETNPDAGENGIKLQPAATGKTFKLQESSNSSIRSSVGLGLQLTNGKYDKISTSPFGKYLPIPLEDSATNSSLTLKLYPNPQRISEGQFQFAGLSCRGNVNASAMANISNLAVECGLMYAPPRLSSGNLDIFSRGRAGQNLTQPIYSCASASKATIKTVTFSYNGTGGFEGLQVLSVIDKKYESTSDKPLWGMENTGMNYSEVTPLWGLVNSKYRDDPKVSTLQSESLWLPGFPEGIRQSLPINPFMNTPGAHFYSAAMSYVYTSLGSTATTPSLDVLGYSGHAQFAMYRRWLELSANAKDSEKIINLVWTDLVANAVVGTKGWAAEGINGDRVEVTYEQRRVHYHIVYAVPAFILLAITLCLILLAIILVAMQRTSLQRMRWFLAQTSLGRNFTALLYSDVASQETPKRTWQDRDGQKLVTVTSSRPFAGGPSDDSEEAVTKTTERPEEEVESSQRFLTK
ncbi:hypothetical protein DE146DRAFT_781147 [Phaeosphaeria sp. MPI-PUGE-AT-0046c]|nr:hypothetical protein DE146DRAFT_781147 [Phaeosphaeria sp. MPI-PUGE-AT-0046c]